MFKDIFAILQEKNELVRALLVAMDLLGDKENPKRLGILEKYLGNNKYKSNNQVKPEYLLEGIFGEEDIKNTVELIPEHPCSIESSVDIAVLKHVFTSLLHENLLLPQSIEHPVYRTSHTFSVFKNEGLLDNIVYGTDYVIKKYLRSVFAINVEDRNGNVFCGTGFLAKFIYGFGDSCALLTNKHVVDPEKFKVTSIRNEYCEIDVKPDPIMSTNNNEDLAAFIVQMRPSGSTFYLSENPELLTTVVSIGYPTIPLSRKQVAICHRGEVNGYIDTFDNQRMILFSCNVAPGNSGGPILDKKGICVGMVTQSNELKIDSDFASSHIYHAAIAPDVIHRFYMEDVSPELVYFG